ncbi:MAG: hypothetical protein A2017_01645 [Lentisphaerae bacterium GWF2_44_16]|nr:MAG: hypothetical protein A2017_01645 [Lentisphaerae bacterium GWF2_44_16]
MKFNRHPLYGKLKLFIFDLDNTALGGYVPYVRFPDKFCKFLDDLYCNGCNWAINTTWDPHGQWELVRQSRVKSHPLFYMGEFGRTIAEDTETDAVPLKNYLKKNDDKIKYIREKYMDVLFKKIITSFPIEKVFHYGHLFQVILPAGQGAALNDFILSEKEKYDEIEIIATENSVSARPSFLNKGLAVREVMRLTGIKANEILTAGDEKADIAMMSEKYSVYSVCPSNASDEVKKCVIKKGGHIGNGKYSDGVMEAFYSY